MGSSKRTAIVIFMFHLTPPKGFHSNWLPMNFTGLGRQPGLAGICAPHAQQLNTINLTHSLPHDVFFFVWKKIVRNWRKRDPKICCSIHSLFKVLGKKSVSQLLCFQCIFGWDKLSSVVYNEWMGGQADISSCWQKQAHLMVISSQSGDQAYWRKQICD